MHCTAERTGHARCARHKTLAHSRHHELVAAHLARGAHVVARDSHRAQKMRSTIGHASQVVAGKTSSQAERLSEAKGVVRQRDLGFEADQQFRSSGDEAPLLARLPCAAKAPQRQSAEHLSKLVVGKRADHGVWSRRAPNACFTMEWRLKAGGLQVGCVYRMADGRCCRQR
eukprot:3934332-Prymnesium_polylepis.2